MSMSFFYLTPFKPHKPAQKKQLKLCHTPITIHNQRPTNTISATVIKGHKTLRFGEKFKRTQVQTRKSS